MYANMDVVVEIWSQYGGKYGIVSMTPDGKVPVTQGDLVQLQSGSTVFRREVRRVVGPVDCPESARILVRMAARNWGERAWVDAATDDELVDLEKTMDCTEWYKKARALKERYRPSPTGGATPQARETRS